MRRRIIECSWDALTKPTKADTIEMLAAKKQTKLDNWNARKKN